MNYNIEEMYPSDLHDAAISDPVTQSTLQTRTYPIKPALDLTNRIVMLDVNKTLLFDSITKERALLNTAMRVVEETVEDPLPDEDVIYSEDEETDDEEPIERGNPEPRVALANNVLIFDAGSPKENNLELNLPTKIGELNLTYNESEEKWYPDIETINIKSTIITDGSVNTTLDTIFAIVNKNIIGSSSNTEYEKALAIKIDSLYCDIAGRNQGKIAFIFDQAYALWRPSGSFLYDANPVDGNILGA